MPCAPSQPRASQVPSRAPAPSSAQSSHCREALREAARACVLQRLEQNRLFEFQATICIQMKVI